MHLKEVAVPTTVIDAFKSVRDESMRMVSHLEAEDFIPQPAAFVSPPRWNLAHTTWFFEEFILARFVEGYRRFHPRYAYLFNSYYNHVGARTLRSRRGDLSRPTVAEIFDYRAAIDDAMIDLLAARGDDRELLDLVTLGINHEQQHQELFWTDIKYTLSFNPLYPGIVPEALVEESASPEKREWLSFPEGLCEFGYAGAGFHFDNESPRHRAYLHDFEIATTLVTNEEFLAFVEDGGYRRFEFWHDDGWNWVTQHAADSPLYWQQDEAGVWYQYTLAGLRPLRGSDPVCHVNYYEAAAYANWAGLRLPTEFEWERASSSFPASPRWQWTESAYLPYPGYRQERNALGEYNGKFMVNQKVLRGGSVATPPGHIRPTYRNFFHPEFGWQFTGIRLAR